MLKSRITRIIAGFIGCAMVFICAAQAANAFSKSKEKYEIAYENADQRLESETEMNNLYRKLMIAGYMYLGHLDVNGKYQGTQYAEKQTISVLQDLGIMNDMGRLDIDCGKDFEYRVSINENDYSNTEKTHDQLSGQYSVMGVNGDVMSSNYFHCWYNDGMFNWFTTNYGMTYYYIGGNGYAIFDFDTKDCDSYVDELGATIYYKLDGTTPIPYDYIDMTQYMVVEDEQTYSFDEYDSYNDGAVYGNQVDDITVIEEQANAEEATENPENIRPTLPVIDEDAFTKTQMPEDGIIITIRPSDEIIASIENEKSAEKEANEYVATKLVNLIPYAVIAAVLALYVLIAGGYSKKEKKFVLTAGDKVFAELYIVIGAAAFFGAVCCCASIDELVDFFNRCYTPDTLPIISGAAAAAVCGILLLVVNSLIIRLKCRSLLKTSIIGRILIKLWELSKKLWKQVKKAAVQIYKKAVKAKTKFLEDMVSRDMLRNDKLTRSFILRTGIAVVLAMIACLISIRSIWVSNSPASAALLIIVCGVIILSVYIYFSLADLKAIQRLNEHISAVNSGDYTERIEALDSPIYVPTEKLNNISTGIQGAVEKQLKSERMKIELVTNVSHDLKTPLTSIISYIDLLSAEELPPAAMDYVKIIEGKSQRLKTMVADLFDLAKATSRTDMQTEEIDAVVLTNQVLGDMADKIEASGRMLKCDIQAESASINADGKKMYRVFQNVIDNALKYSMEGTRIYLTLKNENEKCSITIKNIASYEMTFSPDEITERFTRGDESRSTEGNGLGLSIAKSFTEACGGSFRVDIDGDVFAAIIEMPLSC